MASLSLPSTPTHPFPLSFNRRLTTKPPPASSNAAAAAAANPDDKPNALTVPERSQTQRKVMIDIEKLKKREAKERKEEVNSKIASRKAISIILRREATKALIEKKRGPTNSKKLLPRTVLEALHERIKALRPDSALKVVFFHFQTHVYFGKWVSLLLNFGVQFDLILFKILSFNFFFFDLGNWVLFVC